MSQPAAPLPLKVSDFSKINLKAQAFSNFFFGPPLVLLAAVMMDIPSMSIIRLELLYLVIAIGVYVPFNSLFPYLTVRTLQEKMRTWSSTRETQIGADVVARLIDIPLRHALIVFFTSFFGFLIGVLIAGSGVIPEFANILPVVLCVGLGIGFTVCSIQAFLMYTFTEQYTKKHIDAVVLQNQTIILRPLKYHHFPLMKKIFILTFLSVVAAQLGLLALFISNLLAFQPERLVIVTVYLAVAMLLSLVYVFLAVHSFTTSISTPLQKLKEWSREIIKGNFSRSITIVTNDEVGDVVRDVKVMVDKLQQEQRLAMTEKNKLSVILTGIADGVIAVDDKGKILLLNHAAERITGWLEQEAVDQNLADVFVVFDEDGVQLFDKLYQEVRDTLKTQTEAKRWNGLKLVARDTQEKYVNVTHNQLGSGMNTSMADIFLFHDLTQERILEEMKLDFVSIAAHELRTPLTSVLGYMSVYFDDYGNNLDEDQRMLLGRVQSSAQQLGALVENLLSVTKIEHSTLNLNPKKENWYAIIEEVVGELKLQASNKKIRLVFEPTNILDVWVNVDKLRIKEVLSNLISNAVNFTSQGGAIVIWVEVMPDVVITHISDTGIGIPKESMPRLFTKFFRVSSTLDQGAKGTGLGLYISRAVVEMHGGKIWVESEVDVGSTFSFSLPRMKEGNQQLEKAVGGG